MAVDSILPKPELRFLFGLTAQLQQGRLCFGLAAFCSGAFMLRFVSARNAFYLCFSGSLCGVSRKQ